MAKVLFIQPNYNIDKPNIFLKSAFMPIASVELATFIREKGNHEVIILDRNLHPDNKHLTDLLNKFNPDIVGMTCYTSLVIKDIIGVAKLVKEKSNALTIVGGIHASIEPKSLLDTPNIDYIVRGEGEYPLLEVCSLIDKNKADKNHILKLKNINYNELRPLINLNDLPVPNYDLLEVKKYPFPTFYTSRGCMGRCRFCYNRGRNLRFYDTDKMITLITGVLDKYKIKEFTIADDNFANLSQRTTKICEAISKYNSIFHIFLRADQAHDKVIKELKKAGCWAIQFGFESGSQRILDFIRKDTKIEQNIHAIKQCKKYGIFVDGSFMIGLPTETESEMNQTIDFIKKYKPDSVDVKIFKPYPQTELFDYCVKMGKISPPKTLEEWIPFCNLVAGEPNFSKIPTSILLKTASRFSQPDPLLYIKKTLLLLFRGHADYALFKVKNILAHKLTGKSGRDYS